MVVSAVRTTYHIPMDEQHVHNVAAPEPPILPPPRRQRTHPSPGQQLIIEKPAITEVMEMESGEVLASTEVIGNDYGRLIKLRMRVRTQILRGSPLYKCPVCGVPVNICCSPKEFRFYFKHRHEDGNCPAITAGRLSQDEIDARKYNGAKESRLHLQMKEWLVASLATDTGFKDVAVEKIWRGAWTPEWRKPDVQASYNGIRIAFEIQLSTTHLEVIAARRDFYLREGGLLFWIFPRFETDRLRLLEDDVFFNNNRNAFVLNASTVAESVATCSAKLECIWATPSRFRNVSCLHRKLIGFNDLTLDVAAQKGFYFDFDGQRAKLDRAQEDQTTLARAEFERLFGCGGWYGSEGTAAWDALHRQFSQVGLTLPRYTRELPYDLLQALYSAKHGRPFASKKRLLVEVAHRVAFRNQDLLWFRHALRRFRRTAQLVQEDRSKNWAKKAAAIRAQRNVDPASFAPDRTHQTLIEFLFPELCPLPRTFDE